MLPHPVPSLRDIDVRGVLPWSNDVAPLALSRDSRLGSGGVERGRMWLGSCGRGRSWDWDGDVEVVVGMGATRVGALWLGGYECSSCDSSPVEWTSSDARITRG